MSGKGERVYPSRYETEVLLKDGSRMLLRPIKETDVDLWMVFVSKLSTRTKYLRFHSLPRLTVEDALRFCTVDYANAFAIVAEVVKDQRRSIVAIGRYYRLPKKHSAEVAFVIEDSYQGKGIGTKLMEGLVHMARENDITMFEADVLAENREMMNVLKNYGFHVTTELEQGVYHVTFSIAKTKRVLRKEEERERISTVASLRHLLYPRSVAIIGASTKTGSIGQLLFQCILQNNFSGVVYPINPNAPAVLSVKAYPSILDVPGDVDLAIIAVPGPIVNKVADECGHKGVRTLVVISDGFRERGPEGAERERELRSVTLGHGMRLVGPNCMGVINTDSAVNLNASFSPIYPPRGNVAFLSQSGALGLAILDYANSLNIGISTFLSVGNRADISANDMLQYWEQDPTTKVILLYLESFGNPRKFARIARRVSAKKPIMVVKSGTTPAGSRAASSHTGALATSEIASEALFRQAGIIRLNTLEEVFGVATLLSHQPVPRGRRVAIITNGGGPGILAADACEQHGLVLPQFSEAIQKSLQSVMEREIGIQNPLDLTGGATAPEFEAVLKILAPDRDNDAVIIIFVPPVIVSPKAMEDAIQRVAPFFQRNRKPIVTCFMGRRGFKPELGTVEKMVPSFTFPEDAVVSLAKAAQYGEWRRKPKGKIPRIRGIRRAQAGRIIETAMTLSSRRPLWLSAKEIGDLLTCYGLRSCETFTSKSAEEAAALSSKMGFPVAVKLASSSIVHKTDVGGVRLDLKSEIEVVEAFNGIKSRVAAMGREQEMEGVVIQRMVTGGVEAIVGVTQDPSFGPLIMFGLGGIYAELLKDVAVRLHPLTDTDARELVRSVRMGKIFEGFRGSPPADIHALEDLLLRLSAMIEDTQEIAELDFNPVKVMPMGEGYWIVDARIMLQ
jgi:acetyl coenzyme A synthetase (ADP forming)-like protein